MTYARPIQTPKYALSQNPLAPLFRERERRIREAAYFKAEKRGFAPGLELDDWLEAEQEVDEASRPLPD